MSYREKDLINWTKDDIQEWIKVEVEKNDQDLVQEVLKDQTGKTLCSVSNTTLYALFLCGYHVQTEDAEHASHNMCAVE